ncbi:MAG: YihY/virulence factor BrkB family protein [Jatrophihabitans sp.]|uniref:YihY/virulence factor BrkB family protein n=1 Tax=Jatrophihabitans sp. TaxID=1932789 RepID=UPI003F7ECB17
MSLLNRFKHHHTDDESQQRPTTGSASPSSATGTAPASRPAHASTSTPRPLPASGTGAGEDVDAPTDLPKSSWLTIAKRAAKQVGPDELTDRAAALTYYGVQAIFPGILVLVSVIGLLGRSTANSLVDNLKGIAPGGVTDFLQTVITNAQSQKTAAGILGIVGILLALWSASGYIAGFMRAANHVYGIPEGRPIWKTAPVRLGVTLFTVVCMVLGLIIVVATGSLADKIGSALGIGSTAVTVWEIAKWPVLLILFALMLAVLYWATPNVRQGGFKWVSPGAALAVVVWLVASGLFALYVSNFGSYNKTYGSLATVIIFLVWLWISNLAILIGVEMDAEIERERALREGVPADEEMYAVPRDTRKMDDAQTATAERVEQIRAEHSDSSPANR